MTEELRTPEEAYAPVTGGRGRRLMELEFGRSDDFDDPSREWRRLFSELLGTFLLVLVGAGGAVARSFGPDLVMGDFHVYWAYVVGPPAGALIAVGFAWILRGRGGDSAALAAAQGRVGTPEPPED